MGKTLVPYIIIGVFALLAGAALLYAGLPPTHDGEYHIIRFYEFDKVFRAGVIYPRWAPDLNYGYGVPLFNFVYPLPNYFAVLTHSIGFSFIDSFKISLFAALFLSGVFLYIFAQEFWGKIGGLVAAIFYIFSPYFFVDVYIRGSVGEVWALAFFPLFLWLITKYIWTKKRQFLYGGSLALALVIFSHNILALLFFIFSLAYTAVLIREEKKKKQMSKDIGLLFLLGLFLSAIFWLPALYETRYVQGLQIFNIDQHFPELYQLLIPSWGSGFSGGNLDNQMSFQIGLGNLLAVCFGFISLYLALHRKDKRSRYILFFLMSFFIACAFMLKLTLPLWNNLPLIHYFQFPWRILSLVILICSFLAGSIFGLIKSNIKKGILAVCLVGFVVMAGIGYANVAYYLLRDDSYYITRSNFIDSTNSPGSAFNTMWMNSVKEKPSNTFFVPTGEIIEKEKTPDFYKYLVTMPHQQKATIAIAYFPGWKVFINNKEQKVTVGELGEMVTILPKGKYMVTIKFTDTLIRSIATYTSLLTLLLVLFLLLRSYSVTIKK